MIVSAYRDRVHALLCDRGQAVWDRLAKNLLAPFAPVPDEIFTLFIAALKTWTLPHPREGATDRFFEYDNGGEWGARRVQLEPNVIATIVRQCWEAHVATSLEVVGKDHRFRLVTRWAPWLTNMPFLPNWEVLNFDRASVQDAYAQQKAQDWPLYFKQLDRISFMVEDSGNELGIVVCKSEPVREGEKRRFDGQTETGRNRFQLNKGKVAYFPIFINGEQDTFDNEPALLKLTAPETGSELIAITFIVRWASESGWTCRQTTQWKSPMNW